ncbi:hypothetical protein EMEDMD4_190005 [Sinorhizobium medicae]|uniref:Uncharacterized protein n=1 Tax=Sinorhizobium medicae TaxID=110321 RepID=A0A508WU43_9HYPH|nr:hypothetical protein EMEDMD4_190005 [Sinorhizobium medicae]
MIHLAESLTGFLSVRRTSAASREDNHHTGQQFPIHSILPFLGWDWINASFYARQRQLLRAASLFSFREVLAGRGRPGGREFGKCVRRR